MRISCNQWWATPVWEVETGYPQAFNQRLLQEIDSYLQGNTAARSDTNIWQAKTPNIAELRDCILRLVRQETYDYVAPNYSSGEFDYYHTRGWINRHEIGQDLPLHSHGGAKISATYYISTPDGCGDLLLIDPRGAVDWDNGNDGANGTKFKRVRPAAGKLVFFPSYVLHTVERNRSSYPRISVTTDIATLNKSSIRFFAESLGS